MRHRSSNSEASRERERPEKNSGRLRSRLAISRQGFSLLELQVALVLFAVALSGLYPLVVMHSRQLKHVEQRLSQGTTYYLMPSQDPWARKLGAAAQLRTSDPGPPPPAATLVIDNGDAGYSESGAEWGTETQQAAYHGNQRSHDAGDGSNSASWSFTGLLPGWYDVRITWVQGDNHAVSAPFTINDGLTNRGTIGVNQKLAPSGDTYDGVVWQSLGIFSVATGGLKVVLTDGADGRVVADGVRLVPVRNIVRVNQYTRSLTDDAVSAQVNVTVVTP